MTPAPQLPTEEQVTEAVTDMLRRLGYFAPVGPTASDESEDRARRDALAALVAAALPSRVRRAVQS